MSSISRKELWKQICNDGIDAIMIYSAKNEQGFEVLKANKGSTYNLIDINGLIFSSRKIRLGMDCVYAKPEKLLIDHMVEAGTVAERLMNYGRANSMIKALNERINVSSEILVSSIAWLCAMHDIGKCHVLFQQELGKVNPSITDLLKRLNLNVDDNKTMRHERYGMYIVQDYFFNQFGYDYDSDIDDFAAIIAYHHQGKGSTRDAFLEKIPDVAEAWQQVQMEIIEEINNRWIFNEELLKNRKYRNGFTTCILSIMQEIR